MQTVRSMCVSAGYFLFDLSLLVGFDRKNLRKAHGKIHYPLYVMHHALPLIFWPIAMHYGTFEYFIAWQVRSELTQVGWGLRTIFIGLSIIDTIPGLFVELLFICTFFHVRISPYPEQLNAFLNIDWMDPKLPSWRILPAIILVPIPLLLNAFWWLNIIRVIYIVLIKKKNARNVRSSLTRLPEKIWFEP